VTGICFLTRSIFKETPRFVEVHLAGLSIKEVLAGVEALDSHFGYAIPAPELVPFWAVLGMTVCYYVSAVSAAYDEDFPHFVMGEVFLVLFYIDIPGF